jgi:putative aldouronate transport system permease protein
MALPVTGSYRTFSVFNYAFLALLALSCLYPLLHALALSFSDASLLTVRDVGIVPLGFTAEPYRQLIVGPVFGRALAISVLRVLVGTVANMVLTTLTAYPLARGSRELKGRGVYMWFLVFPLLFSGGLIPTYLWLRQLHLLGSFWVLILPGAVPVFNVIMMMNFFRGLPPALHEAALVDGAGHLRILSSIYIPLSTASIATLSLFCIVGHWNAWFDALVYINEPTKLPLQTVMQNLIAQARDLSKIVQQGNIGALRKLSKKNVTAAAMVISIIPILLAYPFLQRHFISGVVIGSIKE